MPQSDLYAIAEAMPQLVWEARADGTVSFLNDRCIAYTGHAAMGDVARLFGDIVHPDDGDAVKKAWAKSIESGCDFELEYRIRRAADGAYRWFLGRASPVRSENGAIERWIGTATDIDRQKRANENLQFVLDASAIFASAAGVHEICTDFARLAVQRFADWCIVVLEDPSKRYDVVALEHRDAEKVRHVRRFVERFPVAEDLRFVELIERNEATLFTRITEEMLQQSARDEEHLQLLRDLQMQSAIVAPLSVDGRALGAVVMYSAESRRVYGGDDVEVAAMLAKRASDAIANALHVQHERRTRRRLQLVGRAAEAIYESLDLTVTFGRLARLIVSEFADLSIAMRLERDSALRVIAAAHRDQELDEVARTLVGVRPLQPAAEREFSRGLGAGKAIVRAEVDPLNISESVWPYLSRDIIALAPRSAVTIPLQSRGNVYGAIVAYQSGESRPFTDDEIDILSEIGRHASVAMENAEVFERERRMAQTLQDSLLPPSFPNIPGMRFDAVYLPSASAAQVGGDWYDAFKLDDGTVVVSAGDVTGRGPKAAVIMGKVRHLLAIAPCYETDPARILDTVESVLARRYPDVIVTAFLGIIDAHRGSMRFANAGHPSPMLRRTHGVEELRAEGLPLGLRRGQPPAYSRTVDLHDARLLALFTDGLLESEHDIIGATQRLRDTLEKDAVLHSHSPARFIEELMLHRDVDDDVAILTLAFEPTQRWSFDAENAKAGQDARGQFVEFLRKNVSDSEAIAAAELVFGELVGNVVRHAPGPIDIDLDWSAPAPVLHVIDRGADFKAKGRLPEDVLSESGRGLFIVNLLSTTLRVEHIPGYGNHVMAELPLRRDVTGAIVETHHAYERT